MKYLLILTLLIFSSNYLHSEEKEDIANFFIGLNLGYNSFEFHSYDDSDRWRANNENKKTLGLRLELILLDKPDLTFYYNALYFNRTNNLPERSFVSPTTLFEKRDTERSTFVLSDLGFKYNVLNYNGLKLFPKLGLYLSQRELNTYFVEGVEYYYEEDNFQKIELGFNLGAGVSYKIYNIKLILEYNFYDTFKDAPDQNDAFVFWNRNQSVNFILGYEFGF